MAAASKHTAQTSEQAQEHQQQFNPLLFAHNMAESARIWQDILKIIAQEDAFKDVRSGELSMWHLTQDYYQLMTNAMQDPSRLMQLGYVWWSNSASLWQESLEQFLHQGKEDDAPIEPTKSTTTDKRFAGDAWQNNMFFDYIKKQYLMTASWMQDSVERIDGDLDRHAKDKLHFYTKQWMDAIAPSNFLITNPEVLQAALESNGETIYKGLQNLREDFERGKGKLAISTTDNSAFEVGKNLAATPGSVIYQNELMQLLQYEPRGKKVHETPLLLIPAWINKFYIFDMQEKNSYVRWLTEQGYTVFVVSWVNPDARHRNYSFDDYVEKGVLNAMDIVRDIAATDQLSCIGYCLGGTLLASTLAYLHKTKQADKVASATYLTTMIDFSEPGDLGVFIDEEQIQGIEAKMEKKGYLDGSDMAATFSLLRSNNMIWSYVVNNYLLGREPFPFDLLYWNSDPTRMPATMHSFCLRNMYQNNRLIESGTMTVLGEPIDIRDIKTPSFILSTREDHIAPWESTFASTQYYQGDTEFVLAGSGHIAGVINPPIKNKYSFWTHDVEPGMSSELWLRNAEEHKGSWWGHWDAWQKRQIGDAMVTARSLSNKQHKPLEAAPGSYVKAC